MIKNIIFDMDGVLIDSEKCIREACIQMFKNRGLSVVPEDFIPFTGMGEKRFIGGVANKYGLGYTTDMKEEVYNLYDKTAEEHIVLFDRIKELILTLREKGYKLAVASAADNVKVGINLRCLKLSRSDFDAVVTGDDVTKHKPDPAVFLAAAEKMGAKASESLVVEDAVAGCQAAKSAGMACVGVLSTFDAGTLKKAGADETVQKTYDLLKTLELFA